jgi:hypothetical protein
MLDLDHSTEYAGHKDHSAAQCENGDRLILMLIAEIKRLREAHELHEANHARVVERAQAELWAARAVIDAADRVINGRGVHSELRSALTTYRQRYGETTTNE